VHEQDVRVGAKSGSHGPGDDLLILFQICDGGEGKAPVGDLYKNKVILNRDDSVFLGGSTNRSPEMSACENEKEHSSVRIKINVLKKYSRAAGDRNQ
jgi:hypothetical protein